MPASFNRKERTIVSNTPEEPSFKYNKTQKEKEMIPKSQLIIEKSSKSKNSVKNALKAKVCISVQLLYNCYSSICDQRMT